MSNGCCPDGSWPALKVEYAAQGEMVVLPTGMQAYVSGKKDSERAVVVIHDIFGVGSLGRTKAICDQLAGKGFFVVFPDLYRGKAACPLDPSWDDIKEFTPKFPSETVVQDLHNLVAPYIKSQGIERIGLIGFCWGCWIGFNASGQGTPFRCAVNCHPSVVLETLFGRTVEALTEKVTIPQLLLSAGNDPDFVQAGGKVIEILQSKPGMGPKCKVVGFPRMAHGWVNRGDVSQEDVFEDVKKALGLAMDFLTANT